jgi:hypothetical protein
VKRFPRPGNAVAPAVTSDETSEIDRVGVEDESPFGDRDSVELRR